MKKIILLLGLLLASFLCVGHVQEKLIMPDARTFYYTPDVNTTPQINITINQIPGRNGWALIGSTCAGCPSIFYKIQRSANPIIAEDNQWYYYFFFYFFSNSFYSNGNLASSYIRNISFFMNGNFVFNSEYILISPGVPIYAAWLRSPTPNSLATFQISQISVY